MTGWGPQWMPDGRVRFRLWAPDRDAVALELRGGDTQPMVAIGDGWFAAETDAAAGTGYRFRFDDGLVVPDPASRRQDGGPNGWSVLIDPDAYRWRDAEWRGRPWHEAVIQEVHVGLMGGFDGVRERLADIAAIGVTAIELMPIGAFAGCRNWGYDGVLPYAVDENYGTPDELKALIDAAHRHGLMVLLDVVYNHFGPDGNYLGAYAGAFFDEGKHTPWGGAVAVGRAPVARYFIDNALMWLREFRFDGLRFDAVHAIRDAAFLDRMATEIRDRVGDRPVHLILENENNDADRLSPRGYDAQWNDDFHNVLHVLLTGETDAYYADFADRPAERLARCLAEGFVYQGEASANHDGAPRGKPSAHLSPTRFVAFLQNHDQIGNRAFGERLTRLVPTDRLRAATALLLLIPQIPLLFMGDTDGSRSPFLFFTDFHGDLAEAVREGRRGEFAKFAAFADETQRARIPDPNAPATYAASRVELGPDATDWRSLYATLLTLRRERVVPHLEATVATEAQAIGPAAVVARWRLGDAGTFGIAINLGETAVAFPGFDGPPLFSLGDAGAPASFVAWIAQ